MKSFKKGMFLILMLGIMASVTACGTSSAEISTASNGGNSSAASDTQSSGGDGTSNSGTSVVSNNEQSNGEHSAEESSQAEASSPTGETVEAAWFDDAVFLGDSVTLKLSYYCDDNTAAVGEAQFFCAGSLGYTNALWDIDRSDAVHPTYKGTTYLSSDCAVVTGASKVFVMLGMNDVGLYGVDGALESATTLLNDITAKSPDAAIYVQSVTPIMEDGQGSSWNNETIRAFNTVLKKLCQEKGYGYLDVYSVMANENGDLRTEYCSDPPSTGGMGIHFTDEACKVWTDYLKANVTSAMNY